MQEKVVIYLQSNDLMHPSWAIVRRDGSLLEAVLHGESALLAKVTHDREVIVLVPAEDVVVVQVVLPKMNRARLQQALPFALEEQLVDEVESLHFSIGDYVSENQLAVAITARAKIEEWLSLLKEWGVRPEKMSSALFALPFEDNIWHVFLFQGMGMVRAGEYKGFTSDQESLETFLMLALKEQPQPTEIRISNFDNQSWNGLLEGIKIVETKKEPSAFINELVSTFNQPLINLLQGKYAAKKSKLIGRGKLWKTIAVFMITWSALFFLYPTVSFFVLKQRVQMIDKEMVAIYKRNFPHSSSVVAPKLRMEEKLQKLSSDVDQNRLLWLLAHVGKAMRNAVPVKLKRFDFQNNQLTLEITVANSDEFASFTEYLMHEGLHVKQQNANLAGEKISATLLVE